MKFKSIIAALAALAASATMAAAQDAVTFRLNWYLGGLHVPFYYGKDKGYYAAEGIDLTINEGRGSANTVQVVAAGSDTFGLADSSSVVLTASKGADVKSVMSLLNTTGFSVVSLAEAGIKTPKDLEGKKVAVTAGDPLGQLLQAVCKANNVDCGKITMIQVDPAAKVVTVLEKKADALLGGVDDQYFLIKYKGATPAAMRYADFGANIVGMTILTSGDTMKAKPDLNRQSTLDQLKVDIELLDSKNSKGRIGWGAQADWDQTLAILKNYRDLQTDKTWKAFHTNEFVP